MSVSGTYLPPYAPNRPVVSGRWTSLMDCLGGSTMAARTTVLRRAMDTAERRGCRARAPRTATREDRAWGAVAAEAMVATGGSCSLVDDECSTRFPTR